MNKKLDLYRMSFGDDTTNGIYAISLVDKPAIEVDKFLLFNKDNHKYKFENEEQRIIVAPVLIPNQKIYRRNENGYEFEVYFEQEDVDKFGQEFMLNGNQNNVKLNHEVTGNGVKLIYFWKSNIDNELGFDVPKGTLFASYKIFNDEIWKSVKNGEFNGFSIEFFSTPILIEQFEKLDIEKNKKQNNIKMKGKEIIEKITKLFSEDFVTADTTGSTSTETETTGTTEITLESLQEEIVNLSQAVAELQQIVEGNDKLEKESETEEKESEAEKLEKEKSEKLEKEKAEKLEKESEVEKLEKEKAEKFEKLEKENKELLSKIDELESKIPATEKITTTEIHNKKLTEFDKWKEITKK